MDNYRNTIEESFEKMRKRALVHGITTLETKINLARDKEFAREHHLCSVLNFDFAKLTEDEQLIIHKFDFEYKLGYNVDEIFQNVSEFIATTLSEMEETLGRLNSKEDIGMSKEEKEMYENKLNSRIYLFKTCSSEGELLKFLAKNYAMLDLRAYFEAQVESSPNGKSELNGQHTNTSKLNWTGSKIDFIRFVYGYYHSSMLNDGEGEITKLVEKMAYEFNVKLGPGWQADFSNSRTRSSNDAKHFEVFEKGQKGLKQYLEKKDF